MDEPIVSNTVTKTDVCGSSQTEKPRRRLSYEESKRLAYALMRLKHTNKKLERMMMENLVLIRELKRGYKP